MPNHWETSARPLFVKTVFVNGNRHAILSGKDPLLRCGSLADKKISRPNSSISFESDFSNSCSESQDSNFETKTKPKVFTQRQQKDLSTDLQSCLVGLKLASGNLDYKNKSDEEKCLCNSKERKKLERKEKGNSKQRRHNHEKTCRRKEHEETYEESKEYESGGRENDQKSCYVYNLENCKGKKKYCFVKISSQPPQFILNCSCEKTCKETHSSNKNNLVISATIHNIVMTTSEDESILHKTLDYVFPFQNAELHCNSHLTKSCYNSLSDRVFQWLDLSKKSKRQKEKCHSTNENDSQNTDTERIFSGNTFVEEIRKTDQKPQTKMTKKPEKVQECDTSEEADGEVTGEPHVETLLSKDPPSDQENPTKNQSTETVPPLKIQDFLLNYHPKGRQNKKRMKETRNSTQRNRAKDTDSSEEETWRKRTNKKEIFLDKPKQCQNRNLDERKEPIKSPISGEEFPERNQTSINNPNNTRTRPVLIQNLLSPQQPDKMSYLQEEKIVWASEKNTGRPQLHIFMPSILLTDNSEESECENYLNF